MLRRQPPSLYASHDFSLQLVRYGVLICLLISVGFFLADVERLRRMRPLPGRFPIPGEYFRMRANFREINWPILDETTAASTA